MSTTFGFDNSKHAHVFTTYVVTGIVAFDCAFGKSCHKRAIDWLCNLNNSSIAPRNLSPQNKTEDSDENYICKKWCRLWAKNDWKTNIQSHSNRQRFTDCMAIKRQQSRRKLSSAFAMYHLCHCVYLFLW